MAGLNRRRVLASVVGVRFRNPGIAIPPAIAPLPGSTMSTSSRHWWKPAWRKR